MTATSPASKNVLATQRGDSISQQQIDPANSLSAVTAIGTWRLLSFEAEFQATGERRAQFGQHPKGRLILLDDGVMMGLIVAEGREPPTNDVERAVAFNTMVSYSGRYTIRDNELSTDVDISWNESWTGSAQIRFIKILGPDRMRLSTSWMPSLTDQSQTFRGVLDWEREN